MMNVKQGKHQVPFFVSLVWLDIELNPGLPDHWWTLYPLVQWPGKEREINKVILFVFFLNHNEIGDALRNYKFNFISFYT